MPSVHGSRAFEMRKQLSRPIRQFMRNDLPWRAAPKIATRLTGSASPSGSSTVVAARAFTDMVPVWSMLIHETAMLGFARLRAADSRPARKDWDCPTHSPVTARVRTTSFFNFGLKFFSPPPSGRPTAEVLVRGEEPKDKAIYKAEPKKERATARSLGTPPFRRLRRTWPPSRASARGRGAPVGKSKER